MSRINVTVLLAAFVAGVGSTAGLVVLLVRNPPPGELLGFLGNFLGAVVASAITVSGGYFLFSHQQRQTAKLKLAMLRSRVVPMRRILEMLARAPEKEAERRAWLYDVSGQQSAIVALGGSMTIDADFPYDVNATIGLLEISIDRLLNVEAVTQVSSFSLSHVGAVEEAAAETLAKLGDLERALDGRPNGKAQR